MRGLSDELDGCLNLLALIAVAIFLGTLFFGLGRG